jgi:hypothetical protein
MNQRIRKAMPDKSKPKAKRTPRASKPQKSANKFRVVAAATAKAKPTAGDWRARSLAEVRRLIHEADPDIVEERKWVKATNPAGVPVWSHAGIVCTGETYKEVVKLTFAKGASLDDPHRLFNSGLEGNTRRAIDIREGQVLDAKALKALIQAAVAVNLRTSAPKSKSAPKGGAKIRPSAKAKPSARPAKPVKLLSGGNPQIAKAHGDAPVQAYIAAMPGWKHDVGRRLDTIIVQTLPSVRKAVKWNTAFYGVEGRGWFLGFHCMTKYIKVALFRGASLRPLPPGQSKQKEVRYLDIREGDEFDDAQFAAWVKQASQLPGWLA